MEENTEVKEKKIKINKQKGKAINVLSSGQVFGTLIVVFLLIAFIITIFTVRFQNYIERTGVLHTAGEVHEVHEPYNGIITEYVAKIDSYVKKGDVLLKIYIDDFDDDGNPDITSGERMKSRSISVKSPYNGYVLRYDKKTWQKVDIEDSLITIAENDDRMISSAISFINTNDFNAIKLGQKAKVYLDGINADEYGFVTGVVAEIGEKSQTNDDIHRLLGSDALDYSDVLKDDNIYAVRLDLETVDGHLKFSSGKIPDVSPRINQACRVQYIIFNTKPYETFYKDAKQITAVDD